MNEQETIKLIEETLDKIRPFLQRDGGDVDFVGLRDGIVYVTMLGACEGCSLAQDDIAGGVGMLIMEEVPGIVGVQMHDCPDDLMNAYINKKIEEELSKDSKKD